jgi:hypothetical protein
MKKYFSMLSSALAATLAFASCTTTSHVEVAPGVNFSNYKTFGFANSKGVKKSDRVDNQIVDNNIKNSISADLEKQGWKESDQQPDVWVDYNVVVEKAVKQETEPVYSYPYAGYFMSPWRHRMGYYYTPELLGGFHTYNVPFKQGTLTVNMIDAKTNKLIWQGWSQGEVNSNNVTTNEVKGDVKSIFNKLDLPKINA